ncbi:MAG TPA: hypothetical protein VHB73_05660, partial [Alphaproteobacteria bacterium]|nr:hypothetical protein [Alphaproteobacteria bacterium]
ETPDYLDAAFALRAAAVETEMGSRPNRAKSNYKGLFQFNCKQSDQHLLGYITPILAALNAVKGDIPVLQEYPAVTKEMLCKDNGDNPIYTDTLVQTVMFMEVAAIHDVELRKLGNYDSLSRQEKQAAAYLYHNLPLFGKKVVKNYTCDRPLRALITGHDTEFKNNEKVYNKGEPNPAEILARYANGTAPYLKRFQENPRAEDIQPQKTHRWGHSGFMAYAIGKVSNALRCRPA